MCPGPPVAPSRSTLVGLGGHDVPVAQHHGRVEVALDRRGAEAAAGLVERHAPVHADDVGAGLGHRHQQLAGPDAEVDAGHAQVGHAGQHLGAVGEHVPAVVGGMQLTGPRVEQLDGLRSRDDLRPQGGDGQVGEPVEQGVPEARCRRT